MKHKKCPWCGGEPFIMKATNSYAPEAEGFKVYCSNAMCGMYPISPLCYSEKEAWERWDTRVRRSPNAADSKA